jgi:hypothetical protein
MTRSKKTSDVVAVAVLLIALPAGAVLLFTLAAWLLSGELPSW